VELVVTNLLKFQISAQQTPHLLKQKPRQQEIELVQGVINFVCFRVCDN